VFYPRHTDEDKMDNALATTWVLMLVVKAIWIFVIPSIITVAAIKLWRVVPAWIPIAFVAAALVGAIGSILPLLIHMHAMSVQEYGRIAIPIAVATGITRLLFAVACLGLAINVRKRTTEHSLQPIAANADQAGR
jgi:uncharacterized protein YacL